MKDQCQGCRYWHDVRWDHETFGECRRYPPTVIWSGNVSQSISRYAMTQPDDGCGEWRKK